MIQIVYHYSHNIIRYLCLVSWFSDDEGMNFPIIPTVPYSLALL